MTTGGEQVFVTGGSGFVGRAIIRRLIADGRSVRALARSAESQQSVANLGADPAPGDVEDAGSLSRAMRGCDVAYHVAGVNAFCLRDPSPLYRVNVGGSRNVVAAAARMGVHRIVYTSSASTVGERHGTVGNEDTPHRGFFLSDYERSKYEAERAVFDLAQQVGVEVVSVNPSSVQGPGRTGGTGKIFILFLKGRLRFFIDTRVSLIDIDDCTEGHVLAERLGQPQGRYVLNGSVLTSKEALDIAAGITGVRTAPRMVPGTVAMIGGRAMDFIGTLRRRSPSVCGEMVRTLLHGHAYDGSKAERDLGLRYTPVEETLRKTADWLSAERLI
jgi:dihydroflavonol-4-reductase